MSEQSARYFYNDFVPGAVYRLCNKTLTIYGSDGSSRSCPEDRDIIDWITQYEEITEERAVKIVGGTPW